MDLHGASSPCFTARPRPAACSLVRPRPPPTPCRPRVLSPASTGRARGPTKGGGARQPGHRAADGGSEAAASAFLSFSDPLIGDDGGAAGGGRGGTSRFPVNHEINSRIYLWRGQPWNLEVDAVVNSTNESLDERHSSPGLHAAAGSGLVEECTTLGGCRTGMAKMTNAYDLPARKVIHTVGPKYAVKYHTGAENALSHCYRSCLELIENGLERLRRYVDGLDCLTNMCVEWRMLGNEEFFYRITGA